MTRLKRKDIPRTKLENDTISNIGNVHVTLCKQNGDLTFCIDKIALPYLYKFLDLSFQIPLKIVIIELHIDKMRVSSWTWTIFFYSNVFLKPIPECAHKLQYMRKQGLITTKQQKT